MGIQMQPPGEITKASNSHSNASEIQCAYWSSIQANCNTRDQTCSVSTLYNFIININTGSCPIIFTTLISQHRARTILMTLALVSKLGPTGPERNSVTISKNISTHVFNSTPANFLQKKWNSQSLGFLVQYKKVYLRWIYWILFYG